MEIKELRIGNYVDDAVEGLSQVGLISDKDEISLINPNGGSFNGTRLSFVKPVELTEEWLENFGFKKVQYSMFSPVWENKYLTIYGTLSKEYYVIYNSNKIMLPYVHILQNVHFYFSGFVELETILD